MVECLPIRVFQLPVALGEFLAKPGRETRARARHRETCNKPFSRMTLR